MVVYILYKIGTEGVSYTKLVDFEYELDINLLGEGYNQTKIQIAAYNFVIFNIPINS